jgi:hypothetical protein
MISGAFGVLVGVFDTMGFIGFNPPPPPPDWFVSIVIGLVVGLLIVSLTLIANNRLQKID